MSVRYLSGLPVAEISAQSDVYYWSFCPKPPKIGPNWVTKQKKKNRGYLKGKVENGKLKLMDPETIDRWSYCSLCKNLC